MLFHRGYRCCSVTARRTTAWAVRASRLDRADESAQKFPVHLRSERVYIDSLPCEKFSCIFGAIDARGLDLNLLKSCGRQLAAIFLFFQRACNATDPRQHTLANFGQNFSSGDDIGNSEAPD